MGQRPSSGYRTEASGEVGYVVWIQTPTGDGSSRRKVLQSYYGAFRRLPRVSNGFKVPLVGPIREETFLESW